MDRLRISVIAVGVLLWVAELGWTQEQPGPGKLLVRARHVRLGVVQGRIQLASSQMGHESLNCSTDPENDIREQLSFAAEKPGAAKLSYLYTDPRQRLRVDVQAVSDVTINREPRGHSDIASVRLRQPSAGELTLKIDAQDTVQEFAAPSLWHLLLAEPEFCGGYLLPILHSLRPDWRLDAEAARVEHALLAAVRSGQMPDTLHMEQLVRQLRHPRFSQRQAADRQLRGMGQMAVGFLSRLDEASLDVEQRTRVRQICQSLQIADDDTPDRVAAWLAEDRRVWLALLERDALYTRQLAANRLGILLGEPLAFDPRAPAAERRADLHRLRARLGLDRAVLAEDPSGTMR
jgi:hypothetical protein